jgi:histidyl-tRNA synthetase
MTFPLPKYMKIPVYQGFCSGKRAFFIISLLRYFLIKFKHLEENKMKTTKNERKNAHYVIIQSVIIGEDEVRNGTCNVKLPDRSQVSVSLSELPSYIKEQGGNNE